MGGIMCTCWCEFKWSIDTPSPSTFAICAEFNLNLLEASDRAGQPHEPDEARAQRAALVEQQGHLRARRHRLRFVEAQVDADAELRAGRQDVCHRVRVRVAVGAQARARQHAFLTSSANPLIEGVQQAEVVGFENQRPAAVSA